MRVDAEGLDRDRERIRVLDDVGRLTRRDVDRLRAESQQGRMDCRRLVREVQTDRGLDGLGPAGGSQVRLHDEVGPRRQRPGDFFAARHLAGRPSEEVPVWKMRALRIHPLEARSRVVEIPLTQIAGFVEEDSRMVDDLAVARPELDGLDVLELVDRHRQDEVAEQVLAFSRDGERLAHGQDKVGLAQLPAVRKARLCRTVARVALDGSLVDPIPERVDVVRVEPPLPFEMPEFGVGLPRRHEAMLGGRHDLPRPLLDVVVALQCERG